MNQPHYLSPPWSGRYGVEVYSTTRLSGFSNASYKGLNLGLHVGDDAQTVKRNREFLIDALSLKNQPLWLNQVHGTNVVKADNHLAAAPEADGAWTATRALPLAVLTADCLPVVLATGAHDSFSAQAKSVAVVHAGWRGMAAGVLQNAIAALDAKPGTIAAWLGPAIGPVHFEVGPEVRDEFEAAVPGCSQDCFTRDVAENSDRFYADLYSLARKILANHQITEISGGNNCTYRDRDLFYSYRRDGKASGRMATLAVIRNN